MTARLILDLSGTDWASGFVLLLTLSFPLVMDSTDRFPELWSGLVGAKKQGAGILAEAWCVENRCHS